MNDPDPNLPMSCKRVQGVPYCPAASLRSKSTEVTGSKPFSLSVGTDLLSDSTWVTVPVASCRN